MEAALNAACTYVLSWVPDVSVALPSMSSDSTVSQSVLTHGRSSADAEPCDPVSSQAACGESAKVEAWPPLHSGC